MGTRQRGRVWKQGFRQEKKEEVSRTKTLTHKHTGWRAGAELQMVFYRESKHAAGHGVPLMKELQNKTRHQRQTGRRTEHRQGQVTLRCKDKKHRTTSGTQGKTAATPGLVQCCTSADTRAAAADSQGHHEAEPTMPGACLAAHVTRGAPSVASTNHQFKMQAKAPCGLGLR